jgi:hypothetical protein
LKAAASRALSKTLRGGGRLAHFTAREIEILGDWFALDGRDGLTQTSRVPNLNRSEREYRFTKLYYQTYETFIDVGGGSGDVVHGVGAGG